MNINHYYNKLTRAKLTLATCYIPCHVLNMRCKTILLRFVCFERMSPRYIIIHFNERYFPPYRIHRLRMRTEA